MDRDQEIAVIIGAGPAGLTAAYELLRTTDIKPIIYEASDYVGGISKTINYKGNRIDMGGHRFFSKSDRVMDWWLNILPLEDSEASTIEISYQNKKRSVLAGGGLNPDETDAVMLVRNRKSRIYFNRKLFDYPLSLSVDTLLKLGLYKSLRIGLSYIGSVVRPIRPERTLEDLFINRFGRELHGTFFKSYTEKVWGVPCEEINAEWGAQRVKGLSIGKAIRHRVRAVLPGNSDIRQKKTETSLIERFLYPKYGPGQMWETVAGLVMQQGGELHKNTRVVGLEINDGKVKAVNVANEGEGQTKTIEADYVFSSMPVRDLINIISPAVNSTVKSVADGLVYRDFMVVGLLVKKMKIKDPGAPISDNWIYIQEPDVKLGRLQIFNNWSPYMVANLDYVWLGLEYFCNEEDELWNMEDGSMVEFAAEELDRIEIIDKNDVVDGVVLREMKTYPAYFGTYDSFHVIREYVDRVDNLYLMGRNGMHRYNNQDHSMLTAMVAVESVKSGNNDKKGWSVNTESDYHEEK